MKVVLFPDNKLNISVEPIFNGYDAIICQNTDRLKDNKFEVAEIELFRSDIQGTSFLNPRGSLIGENADYQDLLNRVGGTDRISFGIYFNTNAWINPTNGNYEVIPDYEKTAWTSAGANVFANAVVGNAKLARTPNHGQQLYDISNGAYGFDLVSGVSGTSNLSELYNWADEQINTLEYFSGKRLTTISYMNGRTESSTLLMPYFLFGRNSVSSKFGDNPTNVSYNGNRNELLNKANNTRVWDSAGAGNGTIETWNREIGFAKEQVRLAITNNGIYNDFTHWHSVYDTNTLDYFKLYYEGIRNEIGNDNVWCAGVNQAYEYYFIRESVRSLGSFEHENKVFIAYEVHDKYKELLQNGISQKLDCSLLDTPISIEIDLTGTSLAGKNIQCRNAQSIRSLGSNLYILNLPYFLSKEGFSIFEISEATTADYYSEVRPLITRTGNAITTNIKSKLVIWRKTTNGGLADIVEVFRDNNLKTSFTYNFESGYNYYIGAISQFRHSSLIETAL